MATTAAIIFIDAQGVQHAARIGHMGNRVPEVLEERFAGDYQKLQEFVLTGESRGGYSYPADAEPLWETDEDEQPFPLERAADEDFVWLIQENGALALVELEVVVTTKVKIV